MAERSRIGRPAGAEGENRTRILDAARAEFAAKGYGGAALRPIATAAGVDVALIAHYFGNKEGLFVATIELPERGAALLGAALNGPPESWGARLTRGYLDLWENPASGSQMRTLIRSAVGHDRVVAKMQELTTGAAVATDVDDRVPGGRTGLTLAMAHLLGVATMRYLLQVPAVAEPDLETLVGRVAPSVQLHLVPAFDHFT